MKQPEIFVAGVKAAPGSELSDLADRAMHLAAYELNSGAKDNIFDAFHDAVETLMLESTGAKTVWDVGESDRVKMVDDFNKWFLERWAYLRKEVGVAENHCKDLLPFVREGSSSVTNREYEESAAKFFSLRTEFNLFDDYYYDAVSGEMDFALEMKNPAAARLWEMFMQARWNMETSQTKS